MTTTRYGIKENQVRAFNKMIRVSHQKLNLVCDLVRGLPVDRAVDVLKFSKKRVAGEVLKTLLSAVANAEHNKGLNKEDLFVAEGYANQGPTLKRGIWRGRGGHDIILKRTCHITFVLDSVNK